MKKTLSFVIALIMLFGCTALLPKNDLEKYELSLSVNASESELKSSDSTDGSFARLNVIRLCGNDTQQADSSQYIYNAIEISKQTFNQADNVFLCSSQNFPDSLSVTPLAAAYNAPILYADNTGIKAEVINEINRLGAKNAFIIGGTGSLPDSIEQSLSDNGISFERLSANSRFATNVLLSQKLQEKTEQAPTEVFIGYGSAYISCYINHIAAIRKAPILLTNSNALPTETSNYLKRIKSSAKKVYITGDTNIISKRVESEIALCLSNDVDIVRFDEYDYGINHELDGEDDGRCAQSISVSKYFSEDLSGEGVCIATAYGFQDALAGSVMAAVKKIPLLLVRRHQLGTKQMQYIESYSFNTLYVLGSKESVPDIIVKLIKEAKEICPGHKYVDTESGAVIGALGYKMQKCSICGKERVINYKPDPIANVVKSSVNDLNLTFHRCDEDEKTYGLFKSVEVDGKTVDPSNYSAKSGSLNLTLDKSFVSKLSAGTHTVKVLFEDGFSETSIFVAENENEPTVDRLAGKGRYETAAKISNKAYGFETASTVVLAYGLNYADALAGVSLAKAMNAPILLTNLKTLPNETLVEIKRLGASNVIILGGTGAVGEEVEKILKENNLNVERIAGKTRFETATKIAGKMQALNDNKACEDIFFVYAFNSADALSVSAVAAVKGAPVIYLKTNGELDDATVSYLKSVKGSVKNAYVIGGSGVISDDMMKKAGKALGVTPTRVFGKDRFATCVAVNEKFADLLNGDMLCVATGMDFPDALAGGVYAAINKAPLFLVNGKLKTPNLNGAQKTYLKTKAAAKITAFGGEGAVPDSHIEDIAKNSV